MEPEFVHNVAVVQAIGVVPRILEVVCRFTRMRFAAVARVTDRRWIACAVRDELNFGLQPGGELDLKTTLCDEIRQSQTRIVIDDVDGDPHYRGHHTAVKYGLQSYISVPLRYPDGRFFGTLCAIDSAPAKLNNPETIDLFEMFAELIGFHLDAAERLTLSERTLAQIRQDSDLREQFIAILGHDLRNPLTAIQTSSSVLAGLPMNGHARRAVTVIERSTTRMVEMVDNLVDLTRARLGGELPLRLERAGQNAADAHASGTGTVEAQSQTETARTT